MLDSIHLTRWLSQFNDQDIEFTLFPSKKFKSMHPDLIKLQSRNKKIVFPQKYFVYFAGIKDYFYEYYLSKILVNFSRKRRLRNLVEKGSFDYIHAIEIQGSGYLLVESNVKSSLTHEQIIITNWGSDIYFFEKNAADQLRIRKVLQLADFYSAECHRDYVLATKWGFKGQFLPKNPNAGGFQQDVFDKNNKSSDERNLILAKCYGGKFGLGANLLESLEKILEENNEIDVYSFSLTPELTPKAKELKLKYPKRFDFSTNRQKLSYLDMQEKFADAKIYIGASKSDGISTSFLEALVLGAYPIQTNTSCGDEWIKKGFHGLLINTDSVSILDTLKIALVNSDLELYRLENKRLSELFLKFETIKNDSISFYGLTKI
jgi:glycosyltransferase involved in cell wall biosynthesis